MAPTCLGFFIVRFEALDDRQSYVLSREKLTAKRKSVWFGRAD